MFGWKFSLRRSAERLWLIVLFGTPEVAGVGSGLAALSMGLRYAWPDQVFDVNPRFFRPMSDLAPEWAWAILMIAVGTVQIFTVADGNRSVRRSAAMAGVLLWAFLTVMYVRGDVRAPVIPLFLLGVAANAWKYLRLSSWWNAEFEVTAAPDPEGRGRELHDRHDRPGDGAVREGP
jgi:hypothetical protein